MRRRGKWTVPMTVVIIRNERSKVKISWEQWSVHIMSNSIIVQMEDTEKHSASFPGEASDEPDHLPAPEADVTLRKGLPWSRADVTCYPQVSSFPD